MHIRPLNLKHHATPETAVLFARDTVASTMRITGDQLDYSVDSLEIVDRLIERFRNHGETIDSIGETLFGFGCYVGEVFVRHAGGCWIQTPEEHRRLLGMPMVIELPPPKGLCNPIAKVFKRMHNGGEDNLPCFYIAFTGQPIMSIVVPPRSA